MSTTTEALEVAQQRGEEEPTVVETAEEAAFIHEEDPTAVILIRPKSVQL